MNKTLVIAALPLMLLAGCSLGSQTPATPSTTDELDAIKASCQVYFDGCNTCTTLEDGTAACTRIACEQPEKPYCIINLSGEVLTGMDFGLDMTDTTIDTSISNENGAVNVNLGSGLVEVNTNNDQVNVNLANTVNVNTSGDNVDVKLGDAVKVNTDGSNVDVNLGDAIKVQTEGDNVKVDIAGLNIGL